MRVSYICKNRGLNKVALVAVLSTAMKKSGTRLLALFNVTQHSVKLCFGDLRALVSIFVERVADLCGGFLGSLGKLFEELVVNYILYVDTRR